MIDKNKIEIEKSKPKLGRKILNIVIRLFCLLFPVASSFGGYFLSPYIWSLLNHNDATPEYFMFICALLFFLITAVIIFFCTRKVNPIIKITIRNKEEKESMED